MKTILREELASRLGSPGLIVVNVLAREGYEKIHIKGSISMPRAELERGKWRELPKTSEVVVHCSSPECGASKFAAEFLEARGFDVRAYEGGMKEWAEAGLPTEGRLSPREFLSQRYGAALPRPSGGVTKESPEDS